MCAHAQKINLDRLQINLYFASRLRSVNVKDDAFAARDFADFFNRLDHANFVVHPHHRHDNRVGTQRGLEHLHVDQAVVFHVKVRDLEALTLQLAHGVERGFVLGLYRDEVLAFFFVELRGTFECEVDRLRCAAGPDDLFRVAVHKRCYFVARFFDCGLGFPAVRMRARRRVAEMLCKERNHLGRHPRINRGGSAVVHVNRKLHKFKNSGQ